MARNPVERTEQMHSTPSNHSSEGSPAGVAAGASEEPQASIPGRAAAGDRWTSRRATGAASALVAGLIGVAVLVTACHSGGSNAAAGNPSSSGSAAGSGAVTQTPSGPAYAQCMRSHGVTNFPDPQGPNQNRFLISSAVQNNPHYQSASAACESLRPRQSAGGGGGGASQQQLLAFTQCMRANGVSNFPDPGPDGAISLNGVDRSSPQFQHAAQTCASRTGVHLGGQ
jgi:hypothetical protein